MSAEDLGFPNFPNIPVKRERESSSGEDDDGFVEDEERLHSSARPRVTRPPRKRTNSKEVKREPAANLVTKRPGKMAAAQESVPTAGGSVWMDVDRESDATSGYSSGWNTPRDAQGLSTPANLSATGTDRDTGLLGKFPGTSYRCPRSPVSPGPPELSSSMSTSSSIFPSQASQESDSSAAPRNPHSTGHGTLLAPHLAPQLGQPASVYPHASETGPPRQWRPTEIDEDLDDENKSESMSQDQASLDDSDISDNHPGTPPANPPPSPELPVGATDSMGTSQGVASLQHQLAKIQLSEQIMQTKASTSPEST